MALYAGVAALDGDTNNLIQQMAPTYLSPVQLGIFLIMIIGALSSTAESDLSTMSSLVMTDICGQNIAKEGEANPKTMLLVGLITMIVATGAGRYFARGQLSILDLLVFVGALLGALVLPVIARFS